MAREHDQEVLDVVSGGMNLPHIAYEVCKPAKDAAAPWWSDPINSRSNSITTTKGDLRDHTQVIHLTFTHSFHLTLFTPAAPKTSAAPPTFWPGPTLLPSRASLSSPCSAVPLFFPKKERPLRHGGSSGSRGQPRRKHTDFCQRIYPPGVLLPPTLTPFW